MSLISLEFGVDLKSSCELNVVQIGGDRMLVVAFWRRRGGIDRGCRIRTPVSHSVMPIQGLLANLD